MALRSGWIWEAGLAASLYAAVLAGIAPAMVRAMPARLAICTANGIGSADSPGDNGTDPGMAAGHCAGMAVAPSSQTGALHAVSVVAFAGVPSQVAQFGRVQPACARRARGPPSHLRRRR